MRKVVIAVNPQAEPVGRPDTVKLFEAGILRLRALGLPQDAGKNRGEEPSDRVEISDAARLLARMETDVPAAEQSAAGLPAEMPDERLAAFLQAYGGIYGVDFGYPASEAYDRAGRKARPDMLEALRRELRRYAGRNGGAADGKTPPRRSAGLFRLLERLWRRLGRFSIR